MTKKNHNPDANTLDLVILLSMPVITAILIGVIWYLGHYTNTLAAAAG